MAKKKTIIGFIVVDIHNRTTYVLDYSINKRWGTLKSSGNSNEVELFTTSQAATRAITRSNLWDGRVVKVVG
jgi:hypothetical protein